MNLALRVMESAGAGPAVRAAEDRVVSVRVDHATQFTREEFGQFVPGDRDEFVGSTSVAGPGPFSSQPRRTAGPETRARLRTEPARFPSIGEGFASPSYGCTAVTSPATDSAVNIPQWDMC